MPFTPTAASVPTTVAMAALANAMTSETARLLRIMSLWNSSPYHLKVKFVNTARLFDSLKLNAMRTAMGKYRNANITQRYTRPHALRRLIPSPPFPRRRRS